MNNVLPHEPGIVVIGAGEAGLRSTLTLCNRGYEGSITVVGEERHAPYERPPLSKALLHAEVVAPPAISGAGDVGAKGVRLLSGVEAVAVDKTAQSVALSDGRSLAYSRLLIATGAQARPLAVEGGHLATTLRRLDDATRLRANLARCKTLLVAPRHKRHRRRADFPRRRIPVPEHCAMLRGAAVALRKGDAEMKHNRRRRRRMDRTSSIERLPRSRCRLRVPQPQQGESLAARRPPPRRVRRRGRLRRRTPPRSRPGERKRLKVLAVRISTPASACQSATTAATDSGVARPRMRGAASATVTLRPRVRAAAASSRPMKPPPMTSNVLLCARLARRPNASSSRRNVVAR